MGGGLHLELKRHVVVGMDDQLGLEFVRSDVGDLPTAGPRAHQHWFQRHAPLVRKDRQKQAAVEARPELQGRPPKA